MTRYNRQQWIDSFEGQLSLLRPHLTQRLLAAMSADAWVQHGGKGEDPVTAAKAVSKGMDQAKR